jgi:hypothetical protein
MIVGVGYFLYQTNREYIHWLLADYNAGLPIQFDDIRIIDLQTISPILSTLNAGVIHKG